MAKKKAMFHHGNAPAHLSATAMAKTNERRFELFPRVLFIHRI